MNRETKEMLTPIGGHKIIMKSWLTGREKRDIQTILLQDVNFNESEEKQKTEGVTSDKLLAAQDKLLELTVESIEIAGVKQEKILDTILDMHSVDTEFIIAEANKINSPDKIKK